MLKLLALLIGLFGTSPTFAQVGSCPYTKTLLDVQFEINKYIASNNQKAISGYILNGVLLDMLGWANCLGGNNTILPGTINQIAIYSSNGTTLAGYTLGSNVLPTLAQSAGGINGFALLNTSGVLPISEGGTGTATPNLIAGSNISITGSWPNQTISASSSAVNSGLAGELAYYATTGTTVSGSPNWAFSGVSLLPAANITENLGSPTLYLLNTYSSWVFTANVYGIPGTGTLTIVAPSSGVLQFGSTGIVEWVIDGSFGDLHPTNTNAVDFGQAGNYIKGIYYKYLIANGTVPSNSGSCAINTQVGGSTAGSFKANGACAGGTIILALPNINPKSGWTCDFHDLTTPGNVIAETAYTTSSVTASATMTANDLVTFSCTGF